MQPRRDRRAAEGDEIGGEKVGVEVVLAELAGGADGVDETAFAAPVIEARVGEDDGARRAFALDDQFGQLGISKRRARELPAQFGAFVVGTDGADITDGKACRVEDLRRVDQRDDRRAADVDGVNGLAAGDLGERRVEIVAGVGFEVLGERQLAGFEPAVAKRV